MSVWMDRDRPNRRSSGSPDDRWGRAKLHLPPASYFSPMLRPTRRLCRAVVTARQSDYGSESLETKPLVPRAQFLAGNAVPCPGDSLEAVRGDILATRFTDAVRTTGATCQRSLNFLQRSTTQIGSQHRDVLLDRPDRKLHGVRRLHTGRKCLGLTPRGRQNFLALLQQEASISLLWRLRCCSHAYSPFPNLTRKTSFMVCPWIRMFEMIPRLHYFLKFFAEFSFSLSFSVLPISQGVLP